MSGARHTPGPWVAKRDRGRTGSLHSVRVARSPYLAVARVCALVDAEANAHLIAAAPDLLAALKAMKDAAVYQTGSRATRAKTVHAAADAKLVAAYELADAAIAKAEGQ